MRSSAGWRPASGPPPPGPSGWPGSASRSVRPTAAASPRRRRWSGWRSPPPRRGIAPPTPRKSTTRCRSWAAAGTKTVVSWPPRTSSPPGSWLNMPNGPRYSARRNANPPVSWPPGGLARRRWPKPRGAARTPPRPCSPTRPASAEWSVRSPRPCEWPRGTRWPSPRPWGPPPTRWRWPASTRPPRSWPPCAARTRAALPWSSPPKAPSQRPRPAPEPLPTHGTPPPRQPHPPLRAPGRSAPRSWCGPRTGWRRPRPSFCATWWWSLTWAKHAGSFGKILVLRP